jgi:uncharacterized membrane protein
MSSLSNRFAPSGTCNKCGWKGRDWAFKYQSLCSKCYQEWKKKKAEARRANRPSNENIEIHGGYIVTRKVRDRLIGEAESRIPMSAVWRQAEKWRSLSFLAPVLILGLLGLLYIFGLHLPYPEFWIAGMFLVGLLINVAMELVQKRESSKRQPQVMERFEQLARERQQQIDEAEQFYQSPEWRLLRNQVLKEHEHICCNCGKSITDNDDLTVDHVLPRSKFPKKALDKSNMQVLCRSCNARKNDKISECYADT